MAISDRRPGWFGLARSGTPHLLWKESTDHVGIDAVTDGHAGDGGAGLQALLDNLGFERLGVRAS